MFSRTKTFIQVWNYLRVSKWWQNFHFWVNYPFNVYTTVIFKQHPPYFKWKEEPKLCWLWNGYNKSSTAKPLNPLSNLDWAMYSYFAEVSQFLTIKYIFALRVHGHEQQCFLWSVTSWLCIDKIPEVAKTKVSKPKRYSLSKLRLDHAHLKRLIQTHTHMSTSRCGKIGITLPKCTGASQ